ncbi:MAG: hypothetical protein B6U72_06295 [Candidatus Altiarchaeales archaeon ex4484_2]|nr:MAG: hypothetical protein B6U72_06295 [Candidatus Altiarchaeales archaeon ex4484_2]
MDLNHIFAIQCFVTLFIIIDPVGNAPVFLSLLEKYSPRERRDMIRKTILISTVTLIVFTVLGRYIFDFLKINMYSFKIAGGILVFIISLEMLFGRKSRTKFSDRLEDVLEEKEDIVITPLAIPFLTGPGAITTSIVLFNSACQLDKILVILCIPLVYLVSYVILSKADMVFKFMGKTGTKAFVRIMGLMLASIAVQFIVDGVMEAGFLA